MPFRIVERLDLSLFDLMQIHLDGGAVVKTPHVGNWYPNNLAVASLGLRMSVLDRTFGKADENFHPHTLICGGRAEVIADPTLLMTHARVERTPSHMTNRFPIGVKVADCHMQALHDAIPGIDCVLYSDYLRQRHELALKIIQATIRASRRRWYRAVNSDGSLNTNLTCHGIGDLEDRGIYGLTNDESGWLTPNVVNIMLDGIMDAIEHDTTKVYHLSGPDMVEYIGGIKDEIAQIHNFAAKMLNWVPEEITMYLVPVAGMRFAVLEDRQAALDELVDALLSLFEWRRNVGEVRPINQDSYHQLLHSLNKAAQDALKRARRPYSSRINAAIIACPEVCYEINDGTFTSQYDMLETGLGIYIHPWAMEASAGEIVCVCEQLCGMAKSTLRRSAAKAA